MRLNPEGPESVDAAIQAMEAAIDIKVGSYRNNALVLSIVPQLKAKYRAAILERAKEALAGCKESATGSIDLPNDT